MVETGILWKNVKTCMETEEWEDCEDYGADGQERRVYLGSVFSLYPSGKFYMPWACSNVDACPACKGSGSSDRLNGRPVKSRTWKKWHARWKRRKGLSRHDEFLQSKGWGFRPACEHCGGMGSREAYLDECYREELEAEADHHGYCVMNGEGDACDVFVVEYRETEDE